MSSAGVRGRIAAELWHVSNWHGGGVLREAQDWFQAAPQAAHTSCLCTMSPHTRYRIRPQKYCAFRLCELVHLCFKSTCKPVKTVMIRLRRYERSYSKDMFAPLGLADRAQISLRTNGHRYRTEV
jgi:hypothetical protein